MASSDDDDVVFALALSAREAARRPAESASSSSRAPARHPPPHDAPIELGDSSDDDDDEIQILEEVPPPRASGSAARQALTAPPRRVNAVASSSSSHATAAASSSGSSSRPNPRSGYVEANAVRREDVRHREAAELARHRQQELASRAGPYGYAGDSRQPLGSHPAQGGSRFGGPPAPPLPPAESFEEGGMDAEMMLAMHKSREEEARKRALQEKQRALMAETDEEEAMRLAIEASLSAPPPPPAAASSQKRARSASSTSSVTESGDDDDADDAPDPESAFQKQLDGAVQACKVERRKLVIPRAATGSVSFGPLFGRPGLYEDGGRLSGTSTPIVDKPKAPSNPLTETMSRPVQALAATARSTTERASTRTDASTTAASQPAAAAALPTGATRAQMEAERLQRVQARQAAAAAGASAAGAGAAPAAGPSAPKRARISSPIGGGGGEPAALKGKGPESGGRPPLTERFWHATFGMTHNVYASSTGASEGIKRSFRLGDLISEPENLVFTIFSTYCIEPAFLGQCLPHPKRAPIILVSQPPSKDWAGKSARSIILPGVWDRFPWISFGSCHMKFMLLWYIDGRMRVVITTANFFAHDWESIENIVWVQDFKPRTAAGKQRSDFGEQWVEILKALGVNKSFAQVRASLENDTRQLGRLPFKSLDEIADKWDFSDVTVTLIASLAGKREGWDELDSSGIGRLGKVIRKEGWIASAGKELTTLEAQGSSIGEYTRPWTNVVWRMVRGEEPRRFLRAALDAKEHAEGLKVVFPTLRTVDATVLGRPGGGTLFCTAKKFATCPQYFHDALSKRGARTLMHLKVITGVFDSIPQTLGGRSGSSLAALAGRKTPLKQQKLFDSASESSATDDDDDDVVVAISVPKGKGEAPPAAPPREPAGGFMYIGSHNFTPSAWGRVTMAKSATKPTLTIQNYELGVLFPLREADAQTHATSLAPYQRPVRPYRKDDVPWCMDEHMPPGV